MTEFYGFKNDATTSYGVTRKGSSGDQALFYANLGLRNRPSFILLTATIFPPVALVFLLFCKQYTWIKEDQMLVRFGFWRKLLLFCECLGLLAFVPTLAAFIAGFYASFWPGYKQGFEQARHAGLVGASSTMAASATPDMPQPSIKRDILGIAPGMPMAAALSVIQRLGLNCDEGSGLTRDQLLCHFPSDENASEKRLLQIYYCDPQHWSECATKMISGVDYHFFTYKPAEVFADIGRSYHVTLSPVSDQENVPFGFYNAKFPTGETLTLSLEKVEEYGSSASANGSLSIGGIPYQSRSKPTTNEPDL